MRIRDIQILTEAVQDLDTGKRFYDQQQSGIGNYFWDSLLADIESLLIHAGVHRAVNGYHRMLAKRFPYAIYQQRRKTPSVHGGDIRRIRVAD